MPTGRWDWDCFSTAQVCILEQSAATALSPAQEAENLSARVNGDCPDKV